MTVMTASFVPDFRFLKPLAAVICAFSSVTPPLTVISVTESSTSIVYSVPCGVKAGDSVPGLTVRALSVASEERFAAVLPPTTTLVLPVAGLFPSSSMTASALMDALPAASAFIVICASVPVIVKSPPPPP